MLTSKAEEKELFVDLDLDGRTSLKQNFECREDQVVRHITMTDFSEKAINHGIPEKQGVSDQLSKSVASPLDSYICQFVLLQ
jgi:hypothetical protein